MSYRKFARDVGFIGSVQILTSLGNFFLLPIITKSLGTYYYGLWAQINITISLISPLALMGLAMGLIRFLSSETKREVVKEAVYSIIFFVTISGLLTSFLLYSFAKPLAIYGFKEPDAAYFIQVSSLLILLSVLEPVSLYYFRAFRQIKRFSLLTLVEAIGKLLFILILLKMGYGLLGVITATILVQGAIILITLWIIVSQIGFSIPRFSHIKEYLQFSLPLTPNALIRWITESSDKYLITYFLGLGSVGIYSAACSFGSLIQLFVSPLQLILLPEISKLYDQNKISEVETYMSHSLRYFLLVSIPAVFGLSALAKPLLGIFTTADFISGWSVIPVIAFSGLIGGVIQIFINAFFLVKKTKAQTYFNIIGAVSNFLINIFLIPHIGIIGAAFSTLLAYFIMAVLCIRMSQKYVRLDFNYPDVSKSILSSAIMYLMISRSNIISVFGLIEESVIGILIYLLMMFLLKAFNDGELKMIKKIIFTIKSSIIKIIGIQQL